MFRIPFFIFLSLFFFSVALAKDFEVTSPNKQIKVKVNLAAAITWSVSYGGQTLLQPSAISLQLANNTLLGIAPQLDKNSIKEVKEEITAAIPVKSKYIANHYNELRLEFKRGYSVCVRAYDDGVAYRFETTLADRGIEVVHEQADFNFPSNYRVFWPEEEDAEFQSHFENLYIDSLVSDFKPDQYGALPMLLQSANGTNMLISEADLFDYPNLFLFGTGSNALRAGFPKVILESDPVRDRGIKITKLADYIAKTTGKRTFPWRSIAISEDDKGLLNNNLTYKLASPSAIKDDTWVRPGKVAWDWWNANNVYGVDFKSGINNDTYKYYIDFAAKFGLEYVMLDEGWTRSTTDLLHANTDIDIEGLISYAASKHVGVWLWCLWGPLDKDMEAILDQYAAWGAKGIKVDFMARADQYMVNFYERVAREAAKRQLMVDLHGAFKPVGLNRTYPNVLTYEGVRGLENNKWEQTITPGHNTTLPFIRMAAGPMDYTPGAMRNANEKNFAVRYEQPMSMGTRAHQVAMYTIYESPLQMLADNPSNYLADSACTAFIAQIPTAWDETVALQGKIGEYVALARRKGDKWYVAAMTNWDARKVELKLPFLQGSYNVQVLEDGINADRHAADHKIRTMDFREGDRLEAEMASGGGWCAVFSPVH